MRRFSSSSLALPHSSSLALSLVQHSVAFASTANGEPSGPRHYTSRRILADSGRRAVAPETGTRPVSRYPSQNHSLPPRMRRKEDSREDKSTAPRSSPSLASPPSSPPAATATHGKTQTGSKSSRLLDTADLSACVEDIPPSGIDASVVHRAQVYTRGHTYPPATEVGEVLDTVAHTTWKAVSITFFVGDGAGSDRRHVVTAMGISERAASAVTLCYMHAHRLIEYYTNDLPQWEQQRRQWLEKKSHRSPPLPLPPPPPVPKPLREGSPMDERTKGKVEGSSNNRNRRNARRAAHRHGPTAHEGTSAGPPQPENYATWETYTKAAAAYVTAAHARARDAAFLRLRLPKVGSGLVDCAAAIVERYAPASLDPAEARRNVLTRQEQNAKRALEQLVHRPSKQMLTRSVAPHVHVATLLLDPTTDTAAVGVGQNHGIAKARCAMHALCVVSLTQLDNMRNATPTGAASSGGDAASVRRTSKLLARVLSTGKLDSSSGVGDDDVADEDAEEGKEEGSPQGDGAVGNPTRPSAPLQAILASLPPRFAKQYSLYSHALDRERARGHVRFSWNPVNRLYSCRLAFADITCDGQGINRFEAERSAWETALTQLNMFDERMQAVDAFLRECPSVSLDNMPVVHLPSELRASLTARVESIRRSMNLDKPEDETTAKKAFTEVTDNSSTTPFVDGSEQPQRPSSSSSNSSYALVMQSRLAALRADPRYLADFHPRRSTLAMARVRDEVVRTVAQNRVTIVCGTTSCGKTTQVPQYLLDEEIAQGRGDRCHILVTQPRRLTAFGVAGRIAQERLSSVGEDVGYVVRLDAKPGKHITLCTSGVLLQMLASNPTLDGVTHLILDEVHERDISCDVILSLSKQVMERNPAIRIVLMSATMQTGLFEQYFAKPPTISVEGAVYPVREVYLEDIAESARTDTVVRTNSGSAFYSPMFDLVDQHSNQQKKMRRRGGGWSAGRGSTLTPAKTDYQLIAYLVYRSILVDMTGGGEAGKSILIFLPGWKEILAAKQAIETFSFSGDVGSVPRFSFVLLHSTVDAAQQRRCFEPAPPGCVKIVLATNIAESGITIDDAAIVIDTGLIKLTSWVAPGRQEQRQLRSARGTYEPIDDKEAGEAKADSEEDEEGQQLSAAARRAYQSQASSFATQLALRYASRANGTQRKGRAGRTQGGVCYRLFTRHTWDALPAHQEAEIHRVPLTQVLLRLLSMGHAEPRKTLRTFIEPPAQQNVEVSMVQLKNLDAVTAEDKLTPLGRYLAMLPCDPRIGKMIMLGAVLHCMDSVLTVAATADACPFVLSRELSRETQRKRHMFARDSQSDHVSFLNAFNAFCFNQEDSEFARLNYLHLGNLSTISKYKHQYRDILRGSGLISARELATPPATSSSLSVAGYRGVMCVDTSHLSEDAGDVSLVKACICAALFPNVAVLDSTEATDALATTDVADLTRRKRSSLTKKRKLRTKTIASISPTKESACRRIGAPTGGENPNQQQLPTARELMQQITRRNAESGTAPDSLSATPSSLSSSSPLLARSPAMYYVYQEIFSLRESQRRFLTGVTSVSLWALLLFGSSDANTRYFDAIGVCVMDGWLPVRISAESFHALTALKRTLHACVWHKYREPDNVVNNSALEMLRRLCKDVLKAPLHQQQEGLTLNRLVDSGEIISPIQQQQWRWHMATSGAPDSAAFSSWSSSSLSLGDGFSGDDDDVDDVEDDDEEEGGGSLAGWDEEAY